MTGPSGLWAPRSACPADASGPRRRVCSVRGRFQPVRGPEAWNGFRRRQGPARPARGQQTLLQGTERCPPTGPARGATERPRGPTQKGPGPVSCAAAALLKSSDVERGRLHSPSSPGPRESGSSSAARPQTGRGACADHWRSPRTPSSDPAASCFLLCCRIHFRSWVFPPGSMLPSLDLP